jgi:superfamily I DNA/RNA helicase
MVSHEGPPFDDTQLLELRKSLDSLENPDRVEYRNRNAAAVAESDDPRLLIVAGPGTGKSLLFMDRIRYWLRSYPGERIYVSTFVRKLADDLDRDLDRSALTPAEKALVTVLTLHSLARSLIERNNGTATLSMKSHIKMIGSWKDLVWGDVLCLIAEPENHRSLEEFERQFHESDPNTSPPWPALRAVYFRICRFYNALGFAALIAFATEALQENEELDRHRLWIFDEFQDFNSAEERLVEACTRPAIGVLLAGDDDQALYQTLKSSHPDIIRGRYNDEGTAKAMLPFCGRCGQHICIGATGFLERHRGSSSILKVFLPLEVDTSAPRIRVVAQSSKSGSWVTPRSRMMGSKLVRPGSFRMREGSEPTR